MEDQEKEVKFVCVCKKCGNVKDDCAYIKLNSMHAKEMEELVRYNTELLSENETLRDANNNINKEMISKDVEILVLKQSVLEAKQEVGFLKSVLKKMTQMEEQNESK
jgi:hypothetical protein